MTKLLIGHNDQRTLKNKGKVFTRIVNNEIPQAASIRQEKEYVASKAPRSVYCGPPSPEQEKVSFGAGKTHGPSH